MKHSASEKKKRKKNGNTLHYKFGSEKKTEKKISLSKRTKLFFLIGYEPNDFYWVSLIITSLRWGNYNYERKKF